MHVANFPLRTYKKSQPQKNRKKKMNGTVIRRESIIFVTKRKKQTKVK